MSAVPVKHKPATPLPWGLKHGNHVVDNEYALDVAVGSLSSVANSGREAERNAEYIAHAANAYPKLVEALRSTSFDPELIGLEEARRRAAALLREIGEST